MICNCQIYSLRRSIIQAVIFIFCIFATHIVKILSIESKDVIISIDIITLYFSLNFLMALRQNLTTYFQFNNLSKPLNNLIITVLITSLLIIAGESMEVDHANAKTSGAMIFSLLFTLGAIYLFVANILVGLAMIKSQKIQKQTSILYLGYTYAIAIPLSMVATVVLLSYEQLAIFSEAFLIIEIIPPFLAINIYSKLNKQYKQTS